MTTPNQSDTPLTDAEIEKTGPDFVQFFLPDFARDLERKLAVEKRACMEAVKSIQSHRDELAESKAREAMLADALEEMTCQYGCKCGHPSCRDCWRTNDANAALAKWKEAAP